MNIRNKYCLLWIGCIWLLSCKDASRKNHGPIQLGDPATIVTEKDPQKLQDMVTDLNPVIPSTVHVDTPKPVAKVPVDSQKKTVAPAPVAATPVPQGAGLKAEFKETTLFIAGINAKQAGKANLQNQNGAVYTWVSGNIPGNVLHTTGNVTKAAQRYQTIVVLKSKSGDLPLEDLSETTPWQLLKGGAGKYPLTGLTTNELAVPDADASDIKNAIAKSCRKRRYSHKKMQEWLAVAANARKANQRPLEVNLRSVMWKIDGKDASGRMFSKQVRIDYPL